jgi:pimeloyl-ACP methyl ester carboxylesterase
MGIGDFISKAIETVVDTTKKTLINELNAGFHRYSGVLNSVDALRDLANGNIDYRANTKVSSWQDKPVSGNKKTYIVIHGFQSGANKPWVKNIESQLAQRDPSANVVALDWLDDGKGLSYVTAANKTADAGAKLAKYLKDNNIDPSNVTLIGHSLGAHVAGFASQSCKSILGKGVGEIIALDPAGVKFATILQTHGLNKECAERVTVIHTNYTLGTRENLGHLDIHVNPNDFTQPSHDHFVGNHSFAQDVFVELLKNHDFKQPNGSTLNLDFIKNRNGNHEVTVQSSFAQEFNFAPEMMAKTWSDNELVDNFGLHVNSDNSFQSDVNDWLIGQGNTTNHSPETRLDIFQASTVFNNNLDMFSSPLQLNSNNPLPLHMGSLNQVNDSACYLNSLVGLQNSNNIISGQSQNTFMQPDGQSIANPFPV